MTNIWTVGDIQEYGSGFHAKVVYESGTYAVLETLPDTRLPERGGEYFIAEAERVDSGDGDFPWSYAEEDAAESDEEETKLYSNLAVAVANLLRIQQEG